MKRRQFLAVSSLILAGALSACGAGGGPNQDLAQQFLIERNGGTPVAIGVGGPNAPILGLIEISKAELARSDGSRFAGPEMRSWDAGGHGSVNPFRWKA